MEPNIDLRGLLLVVADILILRKSRGRLANLEKVTIVLPYRSSYEEDKKLVLDYSLRGFKLELKAFNYLKKETYFRFIKGK